MTDVVKMDRCEGGVVVLTLNRPSVLNAISLSLQKRLDELVGDVERDPSARCLVITGAGTRSFSAGYDVREMAAFSQDEMLLALLRREEMLWRLASLRLPTIAALNGLAHGAGAIIASSLDLRVGCERTSFRFTAGVHGGANATWSLPLVVGWPRAKEMLYTARSVEADEAERIGLLNSVVPEDRLLEEAVALGARVAANPPAGIQAIKHLLHSHVGRSWSDRFVAENLMMRTTLRPAPVSELYAEFLTAHPGE